MVLLDEQNSLRRMRRAERNGTIQKDLLNKFLNSKCLTDDKFQVLTCESDGGGGRRDSF